MLEKLSSHNRISLSSQPRYVYALIDPRNDEVCYVGVTKNVYSRLSQHVKDASMTDSKGKWITELEQFELAPELEILETINACQDIDRIASEREKHWIQRTFGVRTPQTPHVFLDSYLLDQEHWQAIFQAHMKAVAHLVS